MKRYKHLTARQKLAFSYLNRDDGASKELLDLWQETLAETKVNYERAKEQLVLTGDGRPLCLLLKGRIDALTELVELFVDSRTI